MTDGKGSPTSARIVEDILRSFPKAVDAIVAAKGTKLEGPNIRSGRRRPRTQPYEYPSCPTAEAMQRQKWDDLDPEGAAAIEAATAAAAIEAAAPKKRRRGKENAAGGKKDSAANTARKTRSGGAASSAAAP